MEDSEQCLLDLFRTYKVKSIKNKQENSAMWDILTETYNNATDRNYTKKQLQKRISYISTNELTYNFRYKTRLIDNNGLFCEELG